MLDWIRTLLTLTQWLGDLTRRVGNIETDLAKTKRELERTQKQMADLSIEFTEALAAIDAETTRIAEAVEALEGQITGQGMSEAKEAELLAVTKSLATRLRGIAANPEAPVPVQE